MRKSLFVLSFSLAACIAAAGLVATASAQAPAPAAGNPVLLAQATPPAPNAPGRRGPAARGPVANGQGRPAPTAAERTARRGEMCQDMVARTAGRLAELEVRLNLTSAQTGAFTRWRDLRLAAARSRATECAARPMPPAPGAARGGRGANATPPNPVERLTREETRLQHRLADIQAERPALEALYNGLSAAQRQTLARERSGMGRGLGPRGGMGGNRMFRRGGPGMMGMRGPQVDPGIMAGPGMMGRGPRQPGNPPPPPAQ